MWAVGQAKAGCRQWAQTDDGRRLRARGVRGAGRGQWQASQNSTERDFGLLRERVLVYVFLCGIGDKQGC